VSTFGRSGGRKGPTRTALALVFDTSDGTLGSPINRGSKGLRDPKAGAVDIGGEVHAEVEGCKFFASEIGKFVQGDSKASCLSIVLFNKTSIVGESSQSMFGFSFCGVGLRVVLLPSKKLGGVFAGVSQGQKGKEEG